MPQVSGSEAYGRLDLIDKSPPDPLPSCAPFETSRPPPDPIQTPSRPASFLRSFRNAQSAQTFRDRWRCTTTKN
eukprot:962336-Prorocentrum_minimum.AAC.1